MKRKAAGESRYNVGETCVFGINLTISQDLSEWMSNLWRPLAPIRNGKSKFKVTRREVVWQTRGNEVLTEIAALIGIEHADSYTPDWMSKRTKAIANLIKRMTPEELEKLDAEVERRKAEGNPEDVQQRYALGD